jgi:3'(2'), 5'-bisphosphate nucleotidase
LIINDFKPAISLFQKVGLKIKYWSNDSSLRKIHSKTDMKTEADMRAHDFIFSGLSKLFSGTPIISEENFNHEDARPETYWLVDPIDGTASWYEGYKGYVTQAAFIEDSKPIFGVIYAPELQKTWVGLKGEGAKLNGSIIRNAPLSKKLIFIDNTKNPHGITKKLMDIMDSDDYLECGSLGLKSVFVADGTADLFIKDVVVRDWDLAPAYVILNEVGCCLSLTNGEDYVFNGPMEKNEGFVVARNSSLLRKVISSLNTIK